MLDWREALARGAVFCRVSLRGEAQKAFTPLREEALFWPIYIHDLGETARGEFLAEYAAFVESGEAVARYRCEACRTLVKFGHVLQFKEAFEVEFRRGPGSLVVDA
jgi:hypothetical protein